MIKKVFSVFAVSAIIVSSLSLAGCSSSSNIDETKLTGKYDKSLSGTTLNVYNWGEYISDGAEGSINVEREFERLTGINVSYTTYDSNESMYSILKSGSVSYDIIIPSDYMIQRLASENMLKKIDASKLANYGNIDPRYKGMYYDENNEYSVPYNVGMVGLVYNSTMVEGTPDSWGILFDEKYSGKLLTFNNPRDAFGIAQMYLGKDVNSTDKKDWDEAAELLSKQKKLLKKFVMDDVFSLMQTGETAVAPYYAGDCVTMLENNSELRFFYPKEGTNIFVDAVCIPSSAQNVEAAMMFIDFLLEPQIALANAQYINYASPNLTVSGNKEYLDSLTVELDDGTEFNYSSMLYPSESEMPKTQYFYDLDVDTRSYYESLWNSILAE